MSRDIYDSVLKLVKNMLTQIPYFEMSDKEVEKYVNEKIDKVYKKYRDKRSILKYFERDFERTIKKKITDKLNNNNGYLEIINGYVNYISSKASDEKSLKVLNQLADFLLEYQFSSTPNKLISIISNNTYLFNSIKYFVDLNKEKIINGKLGDLLSNDLVISFIEAYCMYNNIEIKEEYEDLEELSNENDDDKNIFYSDDSVRMLLHEIGQYKVLSDEEQKELIRKSHEGDNSAREKLIQTNLRLVVSIVRKHLGRGVDLLDLFQEGSHGLMNAIDKFDLEKDTKLSTYAIWWIRQAVTRSISDNARTIRVPVHVLEKYNKAVAARNKLEVELGRTPKPEEIADFLDMKVNELLKVLEYGNNDPLSLNSVISDGEDTEFENFIPSNDMSLEDRTFEQEKMQNMMVLLQKSNLSEREMDIIIRRYGLIDGETKTLEELGRFYGVTRERVRQLENKALAKLRNPRYAREFASYTDDPEESLRRVQNFTKEYYNSPHNSKKFVAKENVRNVKPREDHTIYKYLSNYSKESVDELINTLTPASREILRKRFGDDFDNPVVSNEWNIEDKRCFHRLLTYMKKKLENPNYTMRVKPIYKYFNSVDTFAIDTAIETLSLEEKELLRLRYGDDLHAPVYNIDWEYDLENEGKLLKIVDKISAFISTNLNVNIPRTSVNNSNTKTIRNIYDYFSSYTKDRVDLMISLLTEEELRLVKKKFGENLDTYITRPEWAKNESHNYSTKVLQEMKKILEKPEDRQPISIYEILPNCTEEELKYAISLINNEKYREVVEKFVKNGIRPRLDKYEFNSVRSALFKAISSVKSFGIDKTIYEIFSGYTKEQVDYAIASLSHDEFNLLTLRFGNEFNVKVIKQKLSVFQNRKINDLIDNKMKSLLESIKNKQRIKIISIYDYFNEYSKSDVDSMLARLNKDEMRLLRLKFGDRLTLYVRNNNLSEEDYKKYVGLKLRIKNLLKNPNFGKRKTLFEKYSKYPKKDILLAIEKLPEVDKNYLKVYYGADYQNVPIDASFVSKKISAIHNTLNKILKKLHEKRITIYEYFSDYSKDTVNIMLFKLNENELKLLKKKFGENLDCLVQKVKWESEYEHKEYTRLYNKIQRLLKKPNKQNSNRKRKDKTIYEIFSLYTKVEVNNVISSLSLDDLNIISLFYGNDLENPTRSTEWKPEMEVNLKDVHIKIRKKLKKSKEKKISIYEYFSEYTQDEINLMLSKLSENEISLLKIRFGENFDNFVRYPIWTKEDARTYSKLLLKMKKYLKNPNIVPRTKKVKKDEIIKKTSIYEFFGEFSKEDIDNMISKLSESELQTLKKKFGENLDCLVQRVKWVSKDEHKKYIKLYTKIQRLLKNPNGKFKKKKEVIEKKKISIYEYFNDYSKERIDEMLAMLTKEEMCLLKIKFGENLDCLVKRVIWENDNDKKKYTLLYLKMKKLLGESKKVKNVKHNSITLSEMYDDLILIYDLFPGYSKEQVDRVILTLTNQEKYSLTSRYGVDFSQPYVTQQYMSHALCNIILKIRKNLELETPELKQEEVITENVYEDIKYKDELDFRTKKVYNNMVFHHILSLIPRMEAIMLELRFGFYGKIYSTSEIAHLFCRSEIDIIRILKDALEQVKMLTNPVVEEMISIMELDIPSDDSEIKLTRSE